MDSSLILEIFRNQLEQHAVVHSGTYNPQDSTSFKNMYAFIELTVKIGSDSEDGPGETEQQVWKITLNNNTWGEDFKIQNIVSRHSRRDLIKGYFCDEESYNSNMEECVKLITDVLSASTWFKNEKEALSRADVLQSEREETALFIKGSAAMFDRMHSPMFDRDGREVLGNSPF